MDLKSEPRYTEEDVEVIEALAIGYGAIEHILHIKNGDHWEDQGDYIAVYIGKKVLSYFKQNLVGFGHEFTTIKRQTQASPTASPLKVETDWEAEERQGSPLTHRHPQRTKVQ